MKNSLLSILLLFVSAASIGRAEAPLNRLTKTEKLSGWKLLFDGASTNQWRNYKRDAVSDGWKIEDGAIVRSSKGAGDIITKEQFEYFELSLEYKISKGGNSGVMFHVQETQGPPWHTGPEIQVQDNVDGHDPQKAGWLYQFFKPPMVGPKGNQQVLDATRPAGEWNELFLRIGPDNCLVTMNGVKYYNFRLGDRRWQRALEASKFKKFPEFGKAGKGHVCLQDHGNVVAYRNIKIRPLKEDGSVPQPIDGKLPIVAEPAFPNLTLENWENLTDDGRIRKQRILELTYAKGAPETLYVVSQTGEVYRFKNTQEKQEAKLFLDLSDTVSKYFGPGANEQGLLGLAFHPNYLKNRQLFVYYTRSTDDSTVIARLEATEDFAKADPESETIILEVKQPFKNHNGGSIEFGPDGYLYASLGDGGFRNDPLAAGQDLSQLLGKIIRIDVDSDSPDRAYGIPKDNPFVNVPRARGEIYAFGLRNPWRIAFDPATGLLWTGDVGQELWEEVNVIKKGGNYGWSSREGTHAFGNSKQAVRVQAPVIEPVWEYDHGVGKSITGGRIYNSGRLPELNKKYLYADYVSGSIWALTYDAESGKAVRNEQVIGGGVPVLAFGEDGNGEVYFMLESARDNGIYRFKSN